VSILPRDGEEKEEEEKGRPLYIGGRFYRTKVQTGFKRTSVCCGRGRDWVKIY
jgi:hypothetical protein